MLVMFEMKGYQVLYIRTPNLQDCMHSVIKFIKLAEKNKKKDCRKGQNNTCFALFHHQYGTK